MSKQNSTASTKGQLALFPIVDDEPPPIGEPRTDPEPKPEPPPEPDPEPAEFREAVRGMMAEVIEQATRDFGEPRSDCDCHWPDCTNDVLGRMWACAEHWALLPIPIRERLLRTFDLARENNGTATPEYCLAAKGAYRWIELNAEDLKQEGGTRDGAEA
jgi:hypothetical protein